MSWRDAFKEDIKVYLGLPETAVVLKVDEKSGWTYGCSTCSYESFTVEVQYVLEEAPDEKHTELYSGSLTEFLEAVDSV